MAHDTDKARWINEVMDSTKGMSRAAPNADLFEKVTSNLAGAKIAKTASLPVKQWVAAAILLLALNIGSAAYFIGQHKKTAVYASTNPLAAEMQPESTYNY